MSGPTTVIFTTDPLAVLLAAAAIHAAAAVYEGYANATSLRQRHQDQGEERLALQTAADEKGRQGLIEEARAAEAAFEQIMLLAEKMGVLEQIRATKPAQPDTGDSDAQAVYVQAMQGLVARLRMILLTEVARQSTEFADMPEFAWLAAANAAVPQNLVQRQLARVSSLGPVPEHIQKLALELEQLLPGERAHLLATELRVQIQTHIEMLQKRQVQEATALVVAQSLKELGYQVEDVPNTLFVEGGVVHFRRQNWGSYMVRLRVDAKSSAANFNVVRAVAEGENERSVLDHLAEDRWCAEFPALLQALELRGIHMHVTRRLEAGELPVQLVDAAKLPTFAEDDTMENIAKPQTKQLP
jgi:hypothetical protein